MDNDSVQRDIEIWPNALVLADRIKAAVAGRENSEVYMALAILLGRAIKETTRDEKNFELELQKFVAAVMYVLQVLQSPRHDAVN